MARGLEQQLVDWLLGLHLVKRKVHYLVERFEDLKMVLWRVRLLVKMSQGFLKVDSSVGSSERTT